MQVWPPLPRDTCEVGLFGLEHQSTNFGRGVAGKRRTKNFLLATSATVGDLENVSLFSKPTHPWERTPVLEEDLNQSLAHRANRYVGSCVRKTGNDVINDRCHKRRCIHTSALGKTRLLDGVTHRQNP